MEGMSMDDPDIEFETSEAEIDTMVRSATEVDAVGPLPAHGIFVRPVPTFGGTTASFPSPGLIGIVVARSSVLPVAG